MSRAFCTLVTSEDYISGALALRTSLKETKSEIPVVILYCPEYLSSSSIGALYNAFDKIISVPCFKSNNWENLKLLGRTELDVTFTKLSVWDPSLLKFDTVCFLDADTIILKNIDHIFNYVIGNTDTRISNNHQAIFAAAPDIGWPDCFNSGVFVMKPDKKVYDALISFASTRGSFDGGDQGLLNSFFSTWASGETLDGVPPSSRLPFTFNVTPSTVYSYLPAYKEFFNDIQVVHFIGTRKPWRMTRNSNGNLTMTLDMPSQTLDLIYKWWYFYDLYKKSVAPPPHAQQQNAPQLPFIHHKSYYQPLEVRQSRPTQREPMLLNRPRPASPIKKITRPKSRSPLKSRSKSPEKRPMAPSLKPSDFQHTSPPHQLYDNLYTGQSPVPVNPVPGNLYETETQSPFSSSPNLAATKIHHLVDYLDSDGPQFPDDFGTYRVDWEPDVKARSRTTSIGDVKIEDIEDDDERDYTSDEAEPDILKQKKSMTVLKNSPKHANIENLDDSPKLKAVFGVNGSNFGDTLNEDMTVLNFTVPEVQLPELRSLNDEDIRLLEKSKIIEPTASLDEMHLESIGSVVAAEGDFVEGDLEEEEDDELEGLVEDLINALKSENYGK